MAGKVLNKRTLFYVALAFMFVNPQGAGAQEEKFQMRPGIRYTTGSYRIEGWQNQLVQSALQQLGARSRKQSCSSRHGEPRRRGGPGKGVKSR